MRGIGLVAGIEYVKDKETQGVVRRRRRCRQGLREALKRGVFVRLLGGGNVHAVAPPFVISKEQIDAVVSVLDESITVVEKDMGY